MLAAMIAPLLLATTPAPAPTSIYDFKMTAIDGKPAPLEKYKGKVLVVVNVASRCGLTPQYEGLQALYTRFKDRGLVVLGFPANEFAGQEPGTNEEIAKFCELNYGVTFPMFQKIVVKGENTHSLYRWLVANTGGTEIEWNFAKFKVGRDGQVRKRFGPRVKPDAPEFLAEIESALK